MVREFGLGSSVGLRVHFSALLKDVEYQRDKDNDRKETPRAKPASLLYLVVLNWLDFVI